MKKCKSIMLIDDDSLENLVNKKLIESLEITENVSTLSNGNEGILAIKESMETNSPPSLIFVDLNMSVMNGFEFLKEYQQLPDDFTKDIKVVVLTSSINDEDYETANALGCDGYLIKPLTKDAILDEYEKVFYYD